MSIHTIGSDLADLATKVEACRDENKKKLEDSLIAIIAIKEGVNHLGIVINELGVFLTNMSNEHDAELAALIGDVPVVQTETN